MNRLFAPCVVLAIASTLAAGLPACQGEPPKRPNLMHPLIERRAFELVSRVFEEGHIKIEQNREVRVNGKPVTIDMAAEGKHYGISYLTREEQALAGDGVPKRDPSNEALVVIDSDSGDKILVLYERDYMTDDLEGDTHSVTTIVAETKIKRDARDFLLRAVRDKWP